MTFLRNILFGGILIATIAILITTLGAEPCTDEAQLFLNKLQAGDTAAVLTQFGDNTCHCQPRGGYMAYLKFQSGENANLASLFEHKFKIGEMTVKTVPTVEKVKGGHLPWEAPESDEVDVPIIFDKATYSPYFLPRDMAFGYEMKQGDLQQFCLNPSKNFFQDLSVRLRPSVEKGLIPPAKPHGHDYKPEFSSDYFQTLLTGDDAKYLRPEDAGNVVTTDGKTVPATQFENTLPRLKRAVLRLYIGRRGSFQRWAVKKGRIKDPVFELSNGKELALTTPPVALLEGPAQEEAVEK